MTPPPNLTSGASEEIEKAIAHRERPPRPNPLRASLTFGWRALLKIKHVPEQLFDVTLFPVMFTLLFVLLFGGAIAGSTKEYVQFLAPGVMVQTVIFITMYTGMGLNTDIQKGFFDRIKSLPIWQPAAIVGALLGDLLRYGVASAVVIVLTVALGFRPEGGPLGVIAGFALVLLFCFCFTWVWTVLGLLMRTPTSVLNTSMMILFPLTFASNIFVPPDTLPSWLEWFVGVNPISHLVDATRSLMAGDPDGAAIGQVFIYCVVLLAVFAPITMKLYRSKT